MDSGYRFIIKPAAQVIQFPFADQIFALDGIRKAFPQLKVTEPVPYFKNYAQQSLGMYNHLKFLCVYFQVIQGTLKYLENISPKRLIVMQRKPNQDVLQV
jgi:hypothetical protein